MNSTGIPLNASRKSSKGSKGEVTVFADAGRLKVNLPRQYFGGKQVKKALNLKATKENLALAERIAKRMTLDLQDGCFDETLIKYGVKANLKIVSSNDDLPPSPKLGILEIWQMYLEHKQPTLKATTYKLMFDGTYSNAIKLAINAVGEDSFKIRNWLLSNYCLTHCKSILSNLSRAYELAIKKELIIKNPYSGFADELPKKEANKQVNIYDKDEDDKDLYNPEKVKQKAFSASEVDAILEFVKNSKTAYYHILKFLFLTGCRTGEATGLMWGDIKWDNEYVVIDRAYSQQLKSFVSTKTGHARLFPMPKNGELWNLLKSLKEENPGEVVFKSKTGKVIRAKEFARYWRGTSEVGYPGVIPRLIKQGKIRKYLPLYNTRHTFISYQINECGVPPHIVKDWCGHSEDITTNVYRQIDLLTKPVEYGKTTTQVDTSDSAKIQALEQQNLMQAEQIKALQELVANLQKTTQPPIS